jgi:hypothetical protein
MQSLRLREAFLLRRYLEDRLSGSNRLGSFHVGSFRERSFLGRWADTDDPLLRLGASQFGRYSKKAVLSACRFSRGTGALAVALRL